MRKKFLSEIPAISGMITFCIIKQMKYIMGRRCTTTR